MGMASVITVICLAPLTEENDSECRAGRGLGFGTECVMDASVYWLKQTRSNSGRISKPRDPHEHI